MQLDSLLKECFASLDTVILQKKNDDLFEVLSHVPEWLHQLGVKEQESGYYQPQNELVYLEHFLFDAEEVWNGNQSGSVKSGIWHEDTLDGEDIALEATALILDSNPILFLKKLNEDFTEKQAILQQARENQLTHHRLLKEIEKKDVLLHCIVHDLNNPLTAIKGCFALMEYYQLDEEINELVEMGKRQVLKQQALIRDVLDAYSAEMGPIDLEDKKFEDFPVLDQVIQTVHDNSKHIFKQKKVKLKIKSEDANTRVIGEASKLERVISNLLENALRHSPSDSTVAIQSEVLSDLVKVTIQDEGPGVPDGVVLFEKFSQASNKGKVGLGLYFCRITVENWGGNIGFLNRPQGGATFWFELPIPKKNEVTK